MRPAPAGDFTMTPTRYIESIVSLLVIAVSGAVIYESAKLPPGSFDPLGSGTMPAMTGWALIILCVVVLLRAMLARPASGEQDTPIDAETDETGRTTVQAVAFAALTIIYVVALKLKVAHFIPVTVVFLLASLLLLNGVSRRGIMIGIAVSVAFPVLIFLCFTEIFVVDLPGAF